MTDRDCSGAKYKYCYLLCLNTPGNYCTSSTCPGGYNYSSTEDMCKPILSEDQSSAKELKESQKWLIIISMR